jgi:regulatory protein
MIKKTKLATSQIFTKMASFCAYQERCEQEVREKLSAFELTKDEVDNIVQQLIDENFLNEERFALAFAGGKFRTKQWGKTKIRYELQQRRIDKNCIKTALASIDEEAYFKTLQSLATKKQEQEADILPQKLYNYLLSKGYETDLIQKVLKNSEV